jgi:PAS domain S-box-containing protein
MRTTTIRLIVKLFFSLLFLFHLPLPAQTSQTEDLDYVAFDRILEKQGFSNRVIKCFIQDTKGFIWFGTVDGLYRFDGYSYIEYKHNSDDINTISHSNISAMCLDNEGKLWIGTDGGLNQFDPNKESFERYIHKDDDPKSLYNDTVTSICQDKKGFLWVGTWGGGLNRLDPKTKKSKHFILSEDEASHDSEIVHSICEDYSGVLWIGTEKGLFRFNRNSETFDSYHPQKNNPNSLSHDKVRVIYEDKNNILWIGTWGGGLNKYNREKNHFEHYKGNKSKQPDLSDIRIKAICEDNNGFFWIGTRGMGLLQLNRKTKQFDIHVPIYYNTRSLSDASVNAIYEDNNGILWVGTNGGGINTFIQRKEKFVYYRSTPGQKKSYNNNLVLCIYQDPDEAGDVLWLGTYSGLNRFDRKNNLSYQFQKESKQVGLDNYIVRCIREEQNGLFWLGTDNGIVLFDRKTGKFTVNSRKNKYLNTLKNSAIRTIYDDKKGRMWIGTKGGLYLLNPGAQKFIHFVNDPADPHSLSTNFVFCVHEQLVKGKSIIWIGTYDGGLNKFDPEKNRFKHYKVDPENKGALRDNTIRAIYEDNEGALWLATEGGLHKFDSQTETFYLYSKGEVVTGRRIFGILKEDNRFLWISTNLGISKFDKQKGEYKTFYKSYGLHLITFTQNSYWKNNNSGEMFFGGINGFVSFFPDQITRNKNPPTMAITEFKLFNEPVPIEGEDGILTKSLQKTKEIRLAYNQTPFSFEFAALDYTWPDHNKYKYILDPFEKEWVEAKADNRIARYTNVGHGTYTFRVRGTNNDGVWCKDEASIKIIISPPYWHTWWFRVTVGFTIILIFLGIHMFRTNRLRKKIAEQDRVQRILKQARDLAEFRLAEIKKLIAAISSILIAVDSKGEITQWNAASKTIFNIPSDNSVGNHFREVLKYNITPVLLDKMLAKGLGNDNNYENFEIPVKFNSNPAKLLLGVISPIIDKSGQKLGFLLLAEDITDRKEEEFRRNLSQKLESLGIMAANIAHEVKTPLQYIGHNGTFICDSFGGIKEFFQLLNQSIEHLQDCYEEETVRDIKKMVEDYDIEYLLEEIPLASDHIVRGVSRLTAIIQAMKEYSHPGRGIKESADVNQLMESTLVLIRNKKKEILGIETNFNDHLPHIPCYPGELCQVFMNLLINAADAVQERREKEEKAQQPFHGVITVDTSMEDGEIVVSVTDNGCGIPNDIRDNIYNPFFTTKEVGKGTGQGLAVAHKIIIERHKGSLDFNSRVGEGTSFHIRLPIKADGH